MICLSILLRSFLFCFIIITDVFGQLNTEWWKYESEHFSVYFPQGLDWEANQLLTNLEMYRKPVIESQGNDPGRTIYILEEGGFISSAWYSPSESVIHQYISPSSSDFLGNFTTNQIRTTGLHEFSHASHITGSSGIAEKSVSIFGPFLQPNSFLPDWAVEGISVTTESNIFGIEGMLNSGWAEAMIAVQAKYNILPNISVLTHSPNSYYSHNDEYYIGGSFIQYLLNSYGKNTISEFITEINSYWWAPILGTTFPGFVIDRSMKKIYGADSDDLYGAWKKEMKEKYREWEWEGKRITFDGWYKKYLTVWENDIYYMKMVYSEKDVPFFRLVKFDPVLKREQTICELKHWINSPIRIVNEKIYFSTSESGKGYANTTNGSFGTMSVLYELDIKSGKQKEILTDNFRSFCVYPEGEIIYSKDMRNRFGSQLWSFNNGKSKYLCDLPIQISEMTSTGEQIFLSGRTFDQHFNIYEFNINDMSVTHITDNAWTETELSVQDEMLIYTANYNKTVCIYGYNMISGDFYQLTETGFSRRGAMMDSLLYFISLTDLGEDIFVMNPEYKQVDIPKNKTEEIIMNSFPVSKKKVDYSVYKKLFKPYLRAPYFNQVRMSPGFLFKGSDVLSHFRYSSLVNIPIDEKSVSMSTGITINKWSPFYFRGYTDYTDVFSFTSSYPLIVTSKLGKPSVTLSGNTYFGGTEFADRAFTPGIIFYYGYPIKTVLISMGLPIYFSSEEHKKSYGISFRVSSTNKNIYGYFKIDTRFQWRSQNKINFTTRGTGNVKSSYGMTFSPSYTFQLLKLRRGFWKINLFFEDINGRIFMDYVSGEQGKYIAVVGFEGFLETSISMGFLRFSPMVGLALSQNGKWNYYFQFNFPIIR